MTILYDYDPDLQAGPVPSPCIGICKMDEAAGICSGCFRTIDEIIRWSKADDGYKRMVWRDVKHRMFDHSEHKE
ncbi:DUF1289 domain-containing protein [Undibacterium sp.]|uniref:DUF1289 domain-containing protein n=1 Tax=Undibacterium sp. TaxID=1914977 RepID=UPI00374D6888